MSRSDDEAGAVTAELAVGLPLLMLVTLALAWLLGFGMAQIQAVDAAREVARALARGDSAVAAVAIGTAVAPPGARIETSTQGGRVEVRVTGSYAAPVGPWRLRAARFSARAVSLVEVGAPP